MYQKRYLELIQTEHKKKETTQFFEKEQATKHLSRQKPAISWTKKFNSQVERRQRSFRFPASVEAVPEVLCLRQN